MTEARTWSYGDPEPGPDVDVVLRGKQLKSIWWRFGDGWRCMGSPLTLSWEALFISRNTTLTEGIPESEYTMPNTPHKEG